MRKYSKKKTFYRDMTAEKAAKVRELRFTEKLKQVEIAAITGVCQSSVCKIISGQVWA